VFQTLQWHLGGPHRRVLLLLLHPQVRLFASRVGKKKIDDPQQ
jgi:hypothetical protein